MWLFLVKEEYPARHRSKTTGKSGKPDVMPGCPTVPKPSVLPAPAPAENTRASRRPNSGPTLYRNLHFQTHSVAGAARMLSRCGPTMKRTYEQMKARASKTPNAAPCFISDQPSFLTSRDSGF
jgi:hypothetical protein